jgi:predicted nucleic acid-binding protein
LTLVDSSVWIDYFRGIETVTTDQLDDLLKRERVIAGDLIIVEVLQGFTIKREFQRARRALMALDMVAIAGPDIVVEAAMNYRRLRSKGVTVRKTIDTLIATRCLQDGLALLYSDRDFDGFVQHLGLRRALSPIT